MDIGLVNSVGSTNEVSGVKNTGYNQEVKKPDYSKYSFEDLREIPFEEAKTNKKLIEERADELRKSDSFSPEKSIDLFFQMKTLTFSDNDSFNKGFYETMQNTKSGETVLVDMEITQNLKDYYYGNEDVKPSWMVSNDPMHTHNDLTKAQINSIDFSDFISKMSKGFKSQLSEAPIVDDKLKKQYQNIVDSYDILQKSYDKAMRTPYYA